MSTRTSFRPRPVDISKPLPIVRDLSELDTDAPDKAHDIRAATGQPKKPTKEIPTPEVRFVETHYKDYLPVYQQPPMHYAHGKGGSGYRDEAVVEYDLDNEDEDWLEAFNVGATKLSDLKFERMLWRLELACAEATEDALMAAGASVAERTSATALAAIDHLPKELAVEVLVEVGVRDVIANDVYEYWAAKRRRWGKPILRRLQAPTSASDTNPFNVFRPREKVNRPQTRRRRDNPEECVDKLRQMQDNIRAAREIVSEVIRRERRKRDLAHTEVELQRIRLQVRHHPRFNGNLEDAAQYGMAQLKQRNNRNRDLDTLRGGGRVLPNGVKLGPDVRPSKRQRRPELLPFLRQEVSKLPPPPAPLPDEDLACVWPLRPDKLSDQHQARALREAHEGRDAAARRAAAAGAPLPAAVNPKEVLAAAGPALRIPEGAVPVAAAAAAAAPAAGGPPGAAAAAAAVVAAGLGTFKLRLGRSGRPVVDRLDAWTLRPLQDAWAEERAFREQLLEPWAVLPKGSALQEIVDRVRGPPRTAATGGAAAAAAAAAAQQQQQQAAAAARQASAAAPGGGGVGAAGGGAAAVAGAGARLASQPSAGAPTLARMPSGGGNGPGAPPAPGSAAAAGAPSGGLVAAGSLAEPVPAGGPVRG